MVFATLLPRRKNRRLGTRSKVKMSLVTQTREKSSHLSNLGLQVISFRWALGLDNNIFPSSASLSQAAIRSLLNFEVLSQIVSP